MNHVYVPSEFVSAGILMMSNITGVASGLSTWITEEDWNRAIGPWGGLFVSIVLCVVLLMHSSKRIAKEDRRTELAEAARAAREAKDAEIQERRHQEQLNIMRDTYGKLDALVLRQLDAQVATATAMTQLASSCKTLHDEIRSRPCQQLLRDE